MPKPRPVTPSNDTPTEPEPILREEEFFLKIPVLPVTYIGTLIGTNGCHLKGLCAKYKIDSVHLGEHPLKTKQAVGGVRRRRPQNTRGFVSLFTTSPVKVVFKFDPVNEAISMKFKDALIERVQTICQKRQRHFETVNELMY